jgi:hypothetical protein
VLFDGSMSSIPQSSRSQATPVLGTGPDHAKADLLVRMATSLACAKFSGILTNQVDAPDPSATHSIRQWPLLDGSSLRLNPALPKTKAPGSHRALGRRMPRLTGSNWITKLEHETLSLWALQDSNLGPTDYESAALTT